jgi:hypothetical protein
MTTVRPSSELPGISRGLQGVVATLATAAVVLAGSAWWGYRARTASLSPGEDVQKVQKQPARPVDAATPPLAQPADKPKPGATSAQRAAAPPLATTTPPDLEWPLWEFRLREPVPPRVPPLTPPNWRLVGATLSAGTWSVLVLQQGRTSPEFFTAGQELPGGYRIEAIDDEAVTLVKNKRKLLLSYMNAR